MIWSLVLDSKIMHDVYVYGNGFDTKEYHLVSTQNVEILTYADKYSILTIYELTKWVKVYVLNKMGKANYLAKCNLYQ